MHRAYPSLTLPSRAVHLALLLLITSFAPTTVSTTAVHASVRAIGLAAATMTSFRVPSVFEIASNLSICGSCFVQGWMEGETMHDYEITAQEAWENVAETEW